MTKEEAINRLKSGAPFSEIYDPTWDEALDMAISALSENKGEWIPVSERLPEEEQEVLCQLSDDSCAVLYVQDNWGQMDWVDGQMGTGTYDVIAWQPLPEPYKEGGE